MHLDHFNTSTEYKVHSYRDLINASTIYNVSKRLEASIAIISSNESSVAYPFQWCSYENGCPIQLSIFNILFMVFTV